MERSSGKLKMCVGEEGEEGFLQFPTKWDFQCGEMKWNSLNPTKEKLFLAESECMCDKSNCLQGVHFEGGGKRFGFKNRRKLLLSAGTRTWSWQNRDFSQNTHTYVASAARQGSSLGEKLRDSLGKTLGVWGGTCTNLVNNPIIWYMNKKRKSLGKRLNFGPKSRRRRRRLVLVFSAKQQKSWKNLDFSAFGPHHYRLRKDGGRMYRVSLNCWPTQKVYVKEGTSGSRLNN